jgi:hypothetical protein
MNYSCLQLFSSLNVAPSIMHCVRWLWPTIIACKSKTSLRTRLAQRVCSPDAVHIITDDMYAEYVGLFLLLIKKCSCFHFICLHFRLLLTLPMDPTTRLQLMTTRAELLAPPQRQRKAATKSGNNSLFTLDELMESTSSSLKSTFFCF